MTYSYEGFYIDPIVLREFAAKQNSQTPPGKALNALYEFCEKTGKILELEEAFTDTHPSWFHALEQAGKTLGIPEHLSFEVFESRATDADTLENENGHTSDAWLSALYPRLRHGSGTDTSASTRQRRNR